MSSVNKVILLGHLGKDPEVRYLENERTLARFTLATNETYKNRAGERVTSTAWHNIVLWTPLAEIAEKYLSKGRQVYLEGKLTSRSYVDKEGQPKYTTEVVGQHLVLLGGGKGTTTEAPASSTAPLEATPGAEEGDGLPF